jgi:excisionase family DNA binding protein
MKKDGAPDARSIMTVRDVAKYLKCHTSTVYRLLKDSKIPAFRAGSD